MHPRRHLPSSPRQRIWATGTTADVVRRTPIRMVSMRAMPAPGARLQAPYSHPPATWSIAARTVLSSVLNALSLLSANVASRLQARAVGVLSPPAQTPWRHRIGAARCPARARPRRPSLGTATAACVASRLRRPACLRAAGAATRPAQASTRRAARTGRLACLPTSSVSIVSQ